MSWNVASGLENKGVMVTGAAGGIGLATAKAFAESGARVFVVDLDPEKSESVANSLVGEGHAFAGVDLSNLDEQKNLILRVKDSFGEIYALAHLAAVLKRRDSLSEISEEDWDTQIDVNLKASFFLCRSVAELMIENRTQGKIIAFSSQGWWSGGFGGSVVYCASKGGIVSMVRGLSRTLGPSGITVNAIAPGLVDTPMLMDDLSGETFEALKQQTPLQRVADPSEIASVVVFLASDHASYISGATINVSGGFLMY
ncbi:MAG: SDR family NAD(P)-dependent oxidoreductase [Acidimicrobiales bacterium]|nr:SDR family NAD(P)-dependent oxidoreductase [Acidimicrobiales bacterium]